jgi:hypothetical protein
MIMPAISPSAQPLRQWSVALSARASSARPDVGMAWSCEAADGIRTHDLLHGKQTL